MLTRINLGKVVVTVEGAYDSTINYSKLSIVESGGSSYISKKDVPAGTPLTATEYWHLLASKGTSFTYDDMTSAQKEEIAHDATLAAHQAAQYLAAIQAAINNIDPSQSTSDAILAEATTRAAKDAELEQELGQLGLKKEDDNQYDFSIQDNNGNAIVVFESGHIKTKEFDSSDVPTREEVANTHPIDVDNCVDSDFIISDENNKAIAIFEDGHIRTKKFNSKNVVINTLVKSQVKRYKKQVDNSFVFEDVGLIGNWVKRTLDGTPVVSSYSWGSELLFQVKRTTSVSANFILDSITAPVIAYQVDDGEWSTINVASTISIATELNAYEHIIRIRVSSCTLNETMFTNGSGMVNFAGLAVDNNAVITPLDVNNKKILFIGDSITGGVGSSVWQGYAYLLADMLNSQNVQSALAGGGLAHGSRTYLPTAAQVLREMIQGSNNAINEPDVIFIMLGTNDGSQTSAADFTTGYSNLLKYIRKRFGGCHIFACSPFNGTHQTDTQAATQVIDNVTWIPTTELAGTYTTTDGTHPDVAGAKVCADYCYEKITEVLYSNYFN